MTDDGLLDSLYDAIVAGDAETSAKVAGSGLDQGVAALALLFDAMIPALEEVGRLFESNAIFLPEMLISARAMRAGMDLIQPHLVDDGTATVGTFLMGTVAGDIHDIGKNLCNVMLEGAGFKVIDLGVNVSAADFVTAIEEHRPDVVGLSAFLTTTMAGLQITMDAIVEAGLRDRVLVIVGGAPVTREYADEIGADGYAPTAVAAVREVKSLLGL